MEKMQEVPQKENDKTNDEAPHALYVDPRLVQSLDENHTAAELVRTSATAPEHPQQKRTRTAGEKVFDWSVYGGISFIANEVLSGKIQNQATEESGKLYPLYKKTVNGLHRLFRQEATPQRWQNWIKRPADVFIMTLGGTLLVPVVKFLEAHKSELVRFYDRTFHSQSVADESDTRAAHAAMDSEPKQTWWSLWKARLVVIPAAIIADFAIGGKDALSTKLFDKDNRWSSMHRINVQLVRKIAGYFGTPEIKSAILSNANHTKYRFEIQNNEGNLALTGRTYGFLLILSAALAAGFYLTSRIFARRREEHKFYQQMHPTQPNLAIAEAAPQQPALLTDTTSLPRTETETPSPRVHEAATLARVHAPTALQLGAV